MTPLVYVASFRGPPNPFAPALGVKISFSGDFELKGLSARRDSIRNRGKTHFFEHDVVTPEGTLRTIK